MCIAVGRAPAVVNNFSQTRPIRVSILYGTTALAALVAICFSVRQVMATAASSEADTKATPRTRLESLTVAPISLISGEVELPGSKSLSNRVLLLSALAEVTLLQGCLQYSKVRVLCFIKIPP